MQLSRFCTSPTRSEMGRRRKGRRGLMVWRSTLPAFETESNKPILMIVFSFGRPHPASLSALLLSSFLLFLLVLLLRLFPTTSSFSLSLSFTFAWFLLPFWSSSDQIQRLECLTDASPTCGWVQEQAKGGQAGVEEETEAPHEPGRQGKEPRRRVIAHFDSLDQDPSWPTSQSPLEPYKAGVQVRRDEDKEAPVHGRWLEHLRMGEGQRAPSPVHGRGPESTCAGKRTRERLRMGEHLSASRVFLSSRVS